ncbi:InlB B-repeat-containing protein, partial [Candidatus Saccharibacteria bacterium]|nr:InlB B-repeat-containing protein [Candidatus Saccharibacteria bacterium]
MKIIKTDILGAKKTSVAIIAGLVFSVCCSLTLGSDFVLAYTTTLSTSGIVSVDVSSAADGAAMGTDNVVVNSTCPLGYTLSIGGPTDNALYKGGDNTSTSTIPTTTGTVSTPKALVGEGNLGTWGYSTANNTTATSANFIGLSSAANTLITKASGSASGGDTIPVYYGVSVDNTIEPGLYKMSNNNAVTYYLTASANCSIYKIQYNDNGANSSTTMGITHNNVHEDDEVTLAASNYKRTGYGFAGWSTIQLNPGSATFQSDLATAKAAGQVFGPNETITANASFISHATVVNSEQIITLYAIWVPSAGNIQNWTGCSSMTTGQVTALTDQRDNDTYAVAKLADGNCWMIENLRLDYTANISPMNTQSNNGAFGGVFSGLAQPETANFSNSTTANTLYKSDGSGDIAGVNGATLSDIGTTNDPGYRFPRYRNDNTNTNSTINPNVNTNNMTGTGQNIYSYGNYYTWSAAIADTSYYNTNNQSVTATSLCPSGWRLPKGGSKTRIVSDDDNEFWNLIVDGLNNGTLPANYDSSTTPYYTGSEEATPVSKLVRTYPNNFLYSGFAYGSSVASRGSGGFYWSSTAVTSNYSYRLFLSSTSVYPGTYNYDKYYGVSIRCLASTEYTISYNANGGSGTMSDQTVTVGDTVNLTSNSFTRTNYIFAGWNTAANGSGTSYADGQSVSNLAAAGGTITLYAQWKQLLYDKVASMTKGTQTAANLQTAISSSNSGVYTYNSSVFGASTDANNNY